MDIKKYDQHIWNFVFSVGFLILLGFGAWYVDLNERMIGISVFDFILLSLATFRLVRLFVYDKITEFLRDPFAGYTSGPGKTASDLLGCPWCFGVWASASLLFLYFLSPVFWFLILMLAIAGVGSFIQLLINMIGWRAEYLKLQVKSIEENNK